MTNVECSAAYVVEFRTGFHWEYHAGTYLNKEGKTYHLVFYYA